MIEAESRTFFYNASSEPSLLKAHTAGAKGVIPEVRQGVGWSSIEKYGHTCVYLYAYLLACIFTIVSHLWHVCTNIPQ